MNYYQIKIVHEDKEFIRKLGEVMCEYLRRNKETHEDFVNSKILVNYTQNPNEVICEFDLDSVEGKVILQELRDLAGL